ncbi:MAG: DUF4382 domain-containing protein [Thaumarchaeota archaeon]|nr:DUF4382 domain-containing protein [Nitrososphaerota archaeon]
MSSNRSLVFSGLMAAIIAIALVSGAIYVGVLNTTSTTFATPIGQSNSSSQNAVTNSPITETSLTKQIVTSILPSSPSGALAVLMTDPPTVPNGVNHVFITYANLGVHVTGASNVSGWHVVDSVGQIDLMSVINSTETIAQANITSGNFNAIAFNVTSAIVTFQNQNFTAELVYMNHVLFVPISGGVTVSEGKTSVAVIDIAPTVLLLGNLTNPEFAFIPAARAYTVPAQSISSLHLKIGDRDDIKSASWWIQILRGTKFQIDSIVLTPSKLSVKVTNTGNATIVFRLADLSSTSSISGGVIPTSNLPSMLSISEVFAIQSNGTLNPITMLGNGAVDAVIDTAGYTLSVGASATFVFSGNITLGIAQNPTLLHHQLTQQVVANRAYVLTLIGSGLVAETKVSASA